MTDPGEWNSVHFLASLLVPPGAEVLDVGCGVGAVGARLIGAGCSVVGIENDEKKARMAEEAGLEMVVADLEAEDALRSLADRQFDVVLCLDVLEHLRGPGPVLRRVSQFLKPTGVVIISIPNMAHGAVRVAMLEGRIERTEQGLLDRTHLYLYDRAAVEQVCRTAGVEVLERLSLRRQLDQTEIPVDVDRVPDDVRTLIEGDPDAAVYQFLYVACVDRSTVDWPQPHPAVAFIHQSQIATEVIRSTTAQLRARLQDQDRELEGAQAQLRADEERILELEADMERARSQLRRYEEELEAAQAAVSERDALLDRLADEQAERAVLLRRLHVEEDARFAAATELEAEQATNARLRAEHDRVAAELARVRPAADRWEALARHPLVRVYRLAKRLRRRR